MKYALLLIAMLAAAFLAGCAQQAEENVQPAPSAEKAAPKAIFDSAPNSATAGQEVTISWSVSGDAAITPHTAIHYGPSSVKNPTGPQDYAKATPFQCQITNCPIPSPFSAKLKIDEPGTYYYRAHAVINGENVWSEEKAITIAAKAQPQPARIPEQPESKTTVTVTSAPASAAATQKITISWKVEGESSTIPHTAVHYGPASVTNPAGPSDYPLASSFLCAVTPCRIPNAFQAQISIAEPGTHYYRAHAITIDGKNAWSEEKTIEVEAKPIVSGGGGGGY